MIASSASSIVFAETIVRAVSSIGARSTQQPSISVVVVHIACCSSDDRLKNIRGAVLVLYRGGVNDRRVDRVGRVDYPPKPLVSPTIDDTRQQRFREDDASGGRRARRMGLGWLGWNLTKQNSRAQDLRVDLD